MEAGPLVTASGLPVIFAILVALGAWLVAMRLGARGKLASRRVMWGKTRGTRSEWILAQVAALALSAPLLASFTALAGPHALVLGDASSHATIAQAIAREGLPHGWIATFCGGFPVAMHYPPAGWLAAAALIRVGVPAGMAANLFGLAALVATPILVVRCARSAGASPMAALAGAAVLGAVSPYNAFVGSWETHIWKGLLSQAIAMPVVVLWVHALVRRGRDGWAIAAAALLAATHPQLLVAAYALAAPAMLFAADSRARRRILVSGIGAAAMALALYAPGIAAMGIPFGWPPMPAWKIVGFDAAHLGPWLLEGQLLDADRAPILTILWVFAMTVLAARARFPVARAALFASIAAIVLSVSGEALQSLGSLGLLLLSFLQPLRLLAILPLAVAMTVVVAVDELCAAASGLAIERPLLGKANAARAAVAVALTLAIGAAMRARVDWLGGHVAGRLASRGDDECDAIAKSGYRSEVAAAWVAKLDRGRFTYDLDGPIGTCPISHGIEIASATPLGRSAGAGAHVGVAAIAFAAIHPERPKSAARAESLGIRTLLHQASRRPQEGFRVIASHDGIELSEREGGTDAVGVGCIEEIWSGSDAALRAALFADLSGEAKLLERPTRLVAIDVTEGPVVRSPAPADGCSTNDVTVSETAREPGAYEAQITSSAPVDVVLRASAQPTWRVFIDDREVATRLVAPGFFAVRVPSGEHHVGAEFSLPRGYLATIGAALALIVAMAFRGRRSPT